MNLSDVKTRIKRQFGDEAQVQINDTDIVRWVNDAQRYIVSQNELVLQKSATADTVAGQQEYSMPSDFFVLQSVSLRTSTTAPYVSLEQMSQQEFDQALGAWEASTIQQGLPYFFHMYAGVLKVFPIPLQGVAAGLKIYYSRLPTDVATDTDVIDLPLMYHNAVVIYCMQQAYELDEDWAARDKKMSEVQLHLNTNKNRENTQGKGYYPRITVLEEDL